LYGSATWFLKLREEHRCRVFERRVLRIIHRPNRPEVTGVGDDDNSALCSPIQKILSVLSIDTIDHSSSKTVHGLPNKTISHETEEESVEDLRKVSY